MHRNLSVERGKHVLDLTVKGEKMRYILKTKNIWITRVWHNREREEGQES